MPNMEINTGSGPPKEEEGSKVLKEPGADPTE